MHDNEVDTHNLFVDFEAAFDRTIKNHVFTAIAYSWLWYPGKVTIGPCVMFLRYILRSVKLGEEYSPDILIPSKF